MRNVKLSIDTGTFVRFWLVILGFVAAIGLAWISRGVLIMLAIAFFLALVLNRPVSFIARHLPGKSRVLATLLAYLLILVIIALVFFNVVPVFAKQISSFLSSLPAALHSLQDNSHILGDFLNQYNLTNQYESWMKNLQGEIGTIASGVGGSFIGAISNLANAVVNVIMVAVLTFLMLIEGPVWEEKFWRLVYRDREKRRHHQNLARRMYNVVSGYVSGQTMVAILSATLTALAVICLSVFFDYEYSLMWSAWIVIFVMTFVPMFGAVIGGGIVTLMLLLYSWPAALIYLAFFIIEQQIENNIIQPKIQSKRLDMSALLVLIAVTAGLQIAGLLGALISIPVAGCLVVLMRDRLRSRTTNGKSNTKNESEDDSSMIFVEKERKFVKPKLLPKMHHQKSKISKTNRQK